MRRFSAFAGVVMVAGCSQPAPQEVDATVYGSEQAAAHPVPAGEAAGGTPFNVASDSRASYFLLSVEKGDGGNIIATTRREGPSGVSFARREIDCDNRTFRYVGEGDTLDQARRPKPNIGEISELVEGSIADVTVKFACSQR